MALDQVRAVPNNVRAVRGLIWVYFFFLIFEGFLRMILPSLSNALLVIRDPFLILAYVIAHLSGFFPWNRFVITLWVLGLMSTILGFALMPQAPMVILFGFRVCFLHVPLIFLMGKVMDRDDVVRFGKAFLLLSAPIALLMVAQFRGGPESWLNRGLDGQFGQIVSALGKIRPPGTFTYILGPTLFFAYVVGFLLYSQFEKRQFVKWLAFPAAMSTCLAISVSGSRSMLAYGAVVVGAATVAIALSRPRELRKIVQFLLLAGIAFLLASQHPAFAEGKEVLNARITASSEVEGGLAGFIDRALGNYLNSVGAAKAAEITGAGIGLGTNAGSALIYSGSVHFLLAEEEWSRVVHEMGPILGYAFLALRVGLAFWLLRRSLAYARRGSMLPLLMIVVCFLDIIGGQWGQATALGFTVFGAGMCLAAMNEPEHGAPSEMSAAGLNGGPGECPSKGAA